MIRTGVRDRATPESYIMRAIKSRLLFFLILSGSLSFGFAQSYETFSTNFYRASFPVWNFSGPYQLAQQTTSQIPGVSGVPVSYGVQIVQDLSGRLSGSGTTVLSIGSESVYATYSLSGNITLGGSATRAVFTVNLSGRDVLAGQTRGFSLHLSYNVMVDPDPHNPPGWIAAPRGKLVSGNLQISGLGNSAVIPSGPSIPLPAGVDGRWTLALQILPLNRISGAAVVAIDAEADPRQPVGLPVTQYLGFNLAGTYKSGLIHLMLSPQPGSQGNSLQVYLATGEDNVPLLSRVSGKLLGQTVNFVGQSLGE